MQKSNKMIMIILILMPIIGVLGWLLGTNNSDKEDKNISKDKGQEQIRKISIEEANELINKYHNESTLNSQYDIVKV